MQDFKQRTLIQESAGKIGQIISIAGWVHNLRKLGKLNFLLLRDRSGVLQVVVQDEVELEKIRNLQPGSVLGITGKVSATENTDLKVELVDPKIEMINAVTEAWPIEINKPEMNVNLDTLLENRAISLRHPQQAAIFKIQGVMAQAYREFMVKNGFVEYFGPAMLASASEGGAELFRINYMGKPAILAQSNQLYKQMMVGVYERVFAMQKWFRAENSNTRRHLTEGIQYEFEMGFIDSISDVMDKLNEVLITMLAAVEEKCQTELKLIGKQLVSMPADKRIPRLKFKEAVGIVAEITGEDTASWDDLTTESEKVLCEYARKQFGSDFIFITNYPKGKFYAYRDENGEFHNFDLLCREAEIVSGGRRIDNYDQLVASIQKEGLNPEDFAEYLSIFKYGMPPHGGFGLGLERFTMMALGLDNIREATLFPSDTKRIASQSVADPKVFGPVAIKKAIKQLFVDADLEFEVTKHEPTPTSEDSAKVRGLSLESGIKALILRDKKSGKNIMVNVPAHRKLDMSKVNEQLGKGVYKFEFERPEAIQEKYGLQVGGVPPFGHVFGIDTYIDGSVYGTEIVAFNNADQSESLICKSEDLAKVLSAKVGDFAA